MKDLIINGKVIKSIWKTPTPKTVEPKTNETKNIQGKQKHSVSRNVSPFIPESYSNPTASAALKNLIREEERLERERQHEARRNRRKKNRSKKS